MAAGEQDADAVVGPARGQEKDRNRVEQQQRPEVLDFEPGGEDCPGREECQLDRSLAELVAGEDFLVQGLVLGLLEGQVAAVADEISRSPWDAIDQLLPPAPL
jgi:hypothetical protein